jgi:hypothetical protein
MKERMSVQTVQTGQYLTALYEDGRVLIYDVGASPAERVKPVAVQLGMLSRYLCNLVPVDTGGGERRPALLTLSGQLLILDPATECERIRGSRRNFAEAMQMLWEGHRMRRRAWGTMTVRRKTIRECGHEVSAVIFSEPSWTSFCTQDLEATDWEVVEPCES